MPQDVFTMWIFVFSGRTNSSSCHQNASPAAVLLDSASEVELIMQRADWNQALTSDEERPRSLRRLQLKRGQKSPRRDNLPAVEPSAARERIIANRKSSVSISHGIAPCCD